MLIPQAVIQTSVFSELSYVEFTGNVSVTATSDATANTVVTAAAINADGAMIIQIEFYSSCVVTTATTSSLLVVNFYDGATDMGRAAILGTEAAASHESPCFVTRRLVPSAGSHTYSARAWATSVAGGGATVQAGAGGTATNLPGYIRVTRVG